LIQFAFLENKYDSASLLYPNLARDIYNNQPWEGDPTTPKIIIKYCKWERNPFPRLHSIDHDREESPHEPDGYQYIGSRRDSDTAYSISMEPNIDKFAKNYLRESLRYGTSRSVSDSEMYQDYDRSPFQDQLEQDNELGSGSETSSAFRSRIDREKCSARRRERRPN
jgi:hypothetical protein